MAVTSRRQRILQEGREALRGIRQENGFQTDIGQSVWLWKKPKLGTDDVKQYLVLMPKEDQVGEHLNNIPITLPVDIAIVVSTELDDCGEILEAALADVKKAFEADATLGGLLNGGRNNPEGMRRGTTETFPEEAGSEFIGAVITFGLHYAEAWGHPEA